MKLSKEEFDVISNRLTTGGWLTEEWSYSKHRYLYAVTPDGLLFYKSVLCILKTDHLFTGPKISMRNLMKECNEFVHRHTGNKFLITDFKLVQKTVDVTTTKEKYTLTRRGAEWFFVFTKLMGNKIKKGSDSTRMLNATLYGMAVALWSFATYAANKADESRERTKYYKRLNRPDAYQRRNKFIR